LRAKHRLPQALQVLRVCPRSQPGSVQAVRPSAASARSRQLVPEKVCSPIEALPTLNRSTKLRAGFMSVSRQGLASSLGINLQVRLKRSWDSLHVQRWYASPSKYKARLRLTERGLTLPSSGPAYGGPLKSNVRPRQKPHRENTFVIRRTARAIARNSCCRRRFTTRALRQVRFGLVVTGLRSPSVLRSQCTAVASRTREMESTYPGTAAV